VKEAPLEEIFYPSGWTLYKRPEFLNYASVIGAVIQD
jgi:hypothetical protein